MRTRGIGRRDFLGATAFGAGNLFLLGRNAIAKPHRTSVEGSVAKGYESFCEAFMQGQASDRGGAQLCTYHHGKKVVDLWTGADPVKNRPFDTNTVSMVASCTKGVVATAAHMLAQKGKLDLEAPVVRYWPEFAAHDKGDVRVSHLLTHTAGLPIFPMESGVRTQDYVDWSKCTTALAEAPLLWKPGTAVYYHGITYGYLVGEVMRRVDGRTPGTIVHEDICEPLGLTLWIGHFPEKREINYAPYFSDREQKPLTNKLKERGIDVEDPMVKTLTAEPPNNEPLIPFLNSRPAHIAEIPAANAICNAHALAKMYAACIGEVDGVRLLDSSTLARATEFRTKDTPGPGPFAKLPNAVEFSLGYAMSAGDLWAMPKGSFGHAGAGGGLGFAHPASGFAVGYVCNNMVWPGGMDPRWEPWLKALEARTAS